MRDVRGSIEDGVPTQVWCVVYMW